MTDKKAINLHKKLQGKFEIKPKFHIRSKEDLSLLYTPGVAAPCKEILRNKKTEDYTIKGNTVAILSDGSAVLGLGNIGAEASLPVMEGKAVLMKQFGGINAFPICLKTQKTEEIVNIAKNIAPVFGGISLEDISAPRCFEIEEKLQNIGIPVIHDDQHATAIVVLAGLINAAKVVGKDLGKLKIVINGAGAAGTAIAYLLINNGIKNIIVCDTHGAIYERRKGVTGYKEKLAKKTNRKKLKGKLAGALKNADVFIGVSVANILTEKMVKSMADDSIIFALANPNPEIMPDKAKKAGAKVVATGRSDFPNQVNNVLAFPGLFKGLLEKGIKKITSKIKIDVANAIAKTVRNPEADNILPSVFDTNLVKNICRSIK
jgi:malate dehydrogenase (oxaloacetate-decarboxylating)